MRRIKFHWPLALCILALALVGTGCTRQLRKARHLSRGEKAYSAQKFEEAEIEFLKVLQVVPGDPEAIRYLGLIYEQEGNLLRARQLLRNAIQIHPDDTEVRLKLAQNQVELGDSSNAVVNARLVLAKEPGKSEALELLSLSAVSTNGTQDIQDEIRRLQQADKDRAGYHVAYGNLALRRQDLTNAESEFKQALALDPKSTSALLGLA
jgi:Flp pilus assembly protein TadD